MLWEYESVVNLLIGAIDMMKGTWQRVDPPTGSYSQGNHPEVISSHGTRSCNGCGHYGRWVDVSVKDEIRVQRWGYSPNGIHLNMKFDTSSQEIRQNEVTHLSTGILNPYKHLPTVTVPLAFYLCCVNNTRYLCLLVSSPYEHWIGVYQ